jgi:hypothetical protein
VLLLQTTALVQARGTIQATETNQARGTQKRLFTPSEELLLGKGNLSAIDLVLLSLKPAVVLTPCDGDQLTTQVLA